MKIALIGASGNAGSRIQTELVQRGHSVTAIVRHPERVQAMRGVTAVQGDVFDEEGLVSSLAAHDAVISSVPFRASEPSILIRAVHRSGARRYLVVGGAGCLEVAPGLKLMDAPGFPDEYKGESAAGGAFLTLLQTEDELDWSFVCPSAIFHPGERTANFRIGTDRLLSDECGNSSISYEDFAVAIVNELENPSHRRKRFTVGY